MNTEVFQILVVDDESGIRKLLQRFITSSMGYACHTAENAEEALDLMNTIPMDVVVTDINMPGMDGIELSGIIRERYKSDVIIMTGFIDDYTYANMIPKGASDFIQKPVQMKEFELRLNRVIRERTLIMDRERTAFELEKSLEKYKNTIHEVIKAMAKTLEARDPYMAGHQRRVAILSSEIAKAMGLGPEQTEQVYVAGIIHDIGKIAIPAEILSKPSKLTECEFGIIKTHPQVGYDLLRNIEFPWPIAITIHQHHEKLDGSGYPLGLSASDISMTSRILTIADVVEAIASHRPYRPALGIEIAIEEIRHKKGLHYDPDAVDVCINILKSRTSLF